MTQPLMLRLDAAALAALFPEGTQARADLQQAVVAEFVRKNFRDAAFGSDIAATLARARADAMEEVNRARRLILEQALADAGLSKDSWNRYKLANDAAAVVKDAAISAVRSEAHAAAAAAAERARADLQVMVDARLASMTSTLARDAIRKHIDALVSQLSTSPGAQS